MEQLLSNIFDQEKNESAIVSVIQILLTLFETRRPAYVLWFRPRLPSPFPSELLFFKTGVLCPAGIGYLTMQMTLLY